MTKHISKEDIDSILRYHVWASMGVSLIPLPLADFAGLTLVQFNMLRKISKAYGIPFIRKPDKNTLSSWIAVLASFADDAAFAAIRTTALPAVSVSLSASVAKFVPGIGQTAGVITMPMISGAFTYAIGKVFIQHFASGGTFLTFDPEKVKDYYAEMFEEGKKVAVEIRKERKKT
ncbi:YcjF family protein [Desulfonema magnum]|uniref:DUF697 n=1 Tax=Desulfonema magnum TaxID=45655 RepID=A0A975GPD9_9BACT|nr:DUF697 domain-containing protein [Desulfonema magnum]QTA87808.1 DUF697 [Desulfonema magnum]